MNKIVSVIVFLVSCFSQFAYGSGIDEQILKYFQRDFDLDFQSDPFKGNYDRTKVEALFHLIKQAKKEKHFKDIVSHQDTVYGFYNLQINANNKNQSKILLYPVTGKKVATFLSFDSTKDLRFGNLPQVIQSGFIKKQKQMNQLLNRLNAGSLTFGAFEEANRQEFDFQRYHSVFADSNWVLYGLKNNQAVKIKGMQFISFIEAGLYQIDLTFDRGDFENPLFIYDHKNQNERFNITAIPSNETDNALGFKPGSVVVVPLEKNLFYIASIQNNFRGFQILWDNHSRQIQSLRFYWGSSFGNVLMTMDRNYLVSLKSKTFLLRCTNKNHFCDVVSFQDRNFTINTRSDLTAPEI